MKLDIVPGSGNDEFYITPSYAVMPIVPYLEYCNTIWCPFDTEDSNFVKLLRKYNHNVICTHISTGRDFFDCEVPRCDAIVGNPPYSKKTEVLERLFELDVPFAMLVGADGLFETERRFSMFKQNYFEIMYFDKHISYLKDYADQKPSLNPPFSSVYVCHNLLPKEIAFERVKK